MKDYHVFSLNGNDPMTSEVVDHGMVMEVADIPWAGRQLWDCDVARKDGKYYMYFPLKDKNDIFRLGVAISDSPTGPFVLSLTRSRAVTASTLQSSRKTGNIICISAVSGRTDAEIQGQQGSRKRISS